MKEQEINEIESEIKNETKRKLIILDGKISNVLEKLDVILVTLELRCKIKRLKEEVENNKDEFLDHLTDSETKVSKLITDLEYEKNRNIP